MLLFFVFFIQLYTDNWFSCRIVHSINNTCMRFYSITNKNLSQIIIIIFLDSFMSDLFFVVYLFGVIIYYKTIRKNYISFYKNKLKHLGLIKIFKMYYILLNSFECLQTIFENTYLFLTYFTLTCENSLKIYTNR